MDAGRDVWVKIRASEAERAEWHAKARSAGLTLSDLVRRSVGRVRTWTAPAAEVERERTRQVARIGNNLNQIARWANTFKANAEALEVVAHLVAIERALLMLAPVRAAPRLFQHTRTVRRSRYDPGTRTRGFKDGRCCFHRIGEEQPHQRLDPTPPATCSLPYFPPRVTGATHPPSVRPLATRQAPKRPRRWTNSKISRGFGRGRINAGPRPSPAAYPHRSYSLERRSGQPSPIAPNA